MISVKKFLVIFTILLLGVRAMASETPKYPYVERIEVGYKMTPFAKNDSLTKRVIPISTTPKAEKTSTEETNPILVNFAHAFVTTFLFYVMGALIMFSVLLILIAILIGSAKLQYNIAKKR